MSYFHKHHGAAIHHDQIELTVACGVVAVEKLEACTFEFLAGALFECRAAGAHQCVSGCSVWSCGEPDVLVGGAMAGAESICRLPLMGRARPSWNLAHTSTRRMRPN